MTGVQDKCNTAAAHLVEAVERPRQWGPYIHSDTAEGVVAGVAVAAEHFPEDRTWAEVGASDSLAFGSSLGARMENTVREGASRHWRQGKQELG